MGCQDLGERYDEQLLRLEALLNLLGQRLSQGGGCGVEDGHVQVVVMVHPLGQGLQQAGQRPGLGPGPLQEPYVAVPVLDNGLDLEEGGGPGGHLGHPPPFGEVVKGATSKVDVVVQYDSGGISYAKYISFTTAVPQPDDTWSVVSIVNDVIDPRVLNTGESLTIRLQLNPAPDTASNWLQVTTEQGFSASALFN